MHADIHGHRLWYDTYGETGTPVVLVMGFGISGRAWEPQVRSLRRHHRVVIFDNRGIGDSETSKSPYDFGDLADDTIALARHLGLDDAHFVGVSMGGMICQHIGLRHPKRVRSLSLIATHPGGKVLDFLPTMRGLYRFIVANTSSGPRRIEALRRLLYTPSFAPTVRPEQDFQDQSMEIFAVHADTVTRKNQLKAVLTHDVTSALPSLEIPTLVVRPGADLLVRPHHSDRLHALLPRSTLLRFDDAGHGVTHQCADPLNQALLQHFADADQAWQRAAA